MLWLLRLRKSLLQLETAMHGQRSSSHLCLFSRNVLLPARDPYSTDPWGLGFLVQKASARTVTAFECQ